MGGGGKWNRNGDLGLETGLGRNESSQFGKMASANLNKGRINRQETVGKQATASGANPFTFRAANEAAVMKCEWQLVTNDDLALFLQRVQISNDVNITRMNSKICQQFNQLQ